MIIRAVQLAAQVAFENMEGKCPCLITIQDAARLCREWLDNKPLDDHAAVYNDLVHELTRPISADQLHAVRHLTIRRKKTLTQRVYPTNNFLTIAQLV